MQPAKPNVLERAIATISPGWAYRRLAFRSAFEIAASGRAYDGAKTGRRTDGWITGGNSANAEIGPAATRIRDRVRDLVRNNPYASVVPRRLAAKVWGTGIVPRLRIGEIDDPRRVSARGIWQSFVDNSDPEGQLDFYGQMNVLVRSVFESGEALLRYYPRPASWKMAVPLQVAVLEGDYLDSSKNQATADGGVIIQGVEYDARGRRVAYWLFNEHPGDAVTAFTKRMFQSERVPAYQVRHVFEPLRPGQARGVSIFAPVVLKLRDVDDYDDAELMRKKIASCFAAFVTKPGAGVGSPLASTTTTSADGKRIEQVRPGLIQYLNAGEEVEFGSPPSAEGYVDYMKAQLHAVAVGTGTTYSMISGDLKDVNFSSTRVGQIDFDEQCDQWQWLMLIPQACGPTWRRVGETAAAMQLRRTEDPWVPTWSPPKRRFIDPKNDIEAGCEEVRTGKRNPFDLMAEDGEDPEEMVLERKRQHEILDKFGIKLDCDPRAFGRTSAGQAGGNTAAPPSKA